MKVKILTLLTTIVVTLSILLAGSAAVANWYPAIGQGGP